MTDREKLIALILDSPHNPVLDVWREIGDNFNSYLAGHIADHLIANGVVVQKRGWIKVYQNAMYPYSCSECGNCHARKVNFCERCGTKLDLPQPPKEGE